MKILLFPSVLGFLLPPGEEREARATKTRRNRLFKSILEKFNSSRLAFSARCDLAWVLVFLPSFLPSFLSSRVRSISYRSQYLEEKRRWEIEADKVLKMDLNDVPRFSSSSMNVLRHCWPPLSLELRSTAS